VNIFFIVFVISVASGCTNNSTKAPDVTASIRQALDQAGLKDVSVSQDRDKNLITLTGKVPNENDKMQAESIARSIAGTQVVSNQISVRPPGAESTAKKVESDLDKGVDKNLDATLVQHRFEPRCALRREQRSCDPEGEVLGRSPSVLRSRSLPPKCRM
jgi:hypothetical protein